MNRFISLVKKEFNHIFRDRRTLLILFGIPVMQVLIFGYVVNSDFKNIGIAVMDQSGDAQTQKIQNKIFSSGYFNFSGTIFDEKGISDQFKTGKVKAVLVFEPDFGKKLDGGQTANIQIITDASDPNIANTTVGFISGIIRAYQAELNGPAAGQLTIEPQYRMVFNESLISAYMFVPGTMALILMLISALLTSISVTREKELGTLEVILVSPLRPAQIIFGKVVPYVLLAFLNGLVILFLGFFVFGLPISGSLILLLAELLLYITLALSLGILISTIAKSQQVAMFMSVLVLMLPTVLLSGFIFPIENMPVILQWISAILPPRWFIIILKDIMLKGNGLAEVWQETLILFGMTLVFLAAAIRKFSIRLQL
ncbi:MAG: ABC transporter permease [Bacteroidales bacterium]|jgi:ABC-2 type transport system permease protein